MKTKLFLAAMVAAAVARPALAETEYPYIAPNCNLTIVTPPNQNGFYMSEGCHTAYTMPAITGTVAIDSISDIANLDLCTGFKKAVDTDNMAAAEILKLTEKMFALDLNDSRREKLRTEINQIRKDQKDMFANYENVLGAYVQINYTMPDSKTRMKDFLGDNANTFITNGIQLQDAPIGESYMSFVNKADGSSTKLRPVLFHNIPGVKPIGDDGTAEISAVRMNGAISGQLGLTLAGICPMKWKNDFSPNTLRSMLVTNLTYTVPLLTSAGYTAELKSDLAVTNLLDAWTTKTQFTVAEAANMISSGGGDTAFTFKAENLGIADVYSKEAKDSFFATLKTEVRERLTQNLLEQMRVAGFLDLAAPAKIPDAPAPGYVDEVHSGDSCSSDGPFGVFGSSCSSYTYVVKIPHGSSADAIIKKIVDLKFKNTEAVSVREIVPRVYTAIFQGAK